MAVPARNQQAKIIPSVAESDTYLSKEDYFGEGRKVKFVTYGCQMNINDMETVRSILFANGYVETDDERMADIVLLMTCSIREGAEGKVWRMLKRLRRKGAKRQTIGVLGCMAERVRHRLLTDENAVDIVAGPDSYRDLPRLLAVTRTGHSAINVQLSLEETYADVSPVRVDSAAKSAFVSIMRGCDNMCTYCIVPFTRGRERSRPLRSIVEEVKRLSDQGCKQVVLLGQNVNSYRDTSEISYASSGVDNVGLSPGFKTVYRPKKGGLSFLTLLERVSNVDPEMRIRFTSPHPKDFPIQVLELIKDRVNICNQIHLPAQSGSNAVLETMGRGYTRESYLALVHQIRQLIPDVSLTSDFIAGFCGESENDHKETLDLIRHVKYSFCYVFPYSMREQSKRSSTAVSGRADGGTKVVVENCEVDGCDESRQLRPGDYVAVEIKEANSQTLIGRALRRTTLQEFANERFRIGRLADVL
ncbi:unnamed protein product [Toxocara canis]|uniref:MTTase N-terminal domain-containing protein n=1 Tax=Toxocara canis TaxID=6265 RepID=A0A183V788_TOXCA|nr:unnamed protein product [Toxocara canis]